MNSQNAQNSYEKVNDLFNQIKNSDMARRAKKDFLIVARRGNQATRKAIGEFINYLEEHPDVREWLKSSAVIGVALEMIPLSRFGIILTPGYVPGAVAGFMKGSRADSILQSTVIGGLVSWPLKPIITLSPIVGMLMMGLASGTIEEMLAGAAKEVSPEVAVG